MNKIDKITLLTAGIATCLGGFMHFSFFILFNSQEIKQCLNDVLILHSLNAGSILLSFTVAYISVFHASDLINTRIGKPLLLSFALLYIIRLVAEFVFASYNIFWIAACLILALVYIRIFVKSYKRDVYYNE